MRSNGSFISVLGYNKVLVVLVLKNRNGEGEEDEEERDGLPILLLFFGIK